MMNLQSKGIQSNLISLGLAVLSILTVIMLHWFGLFDQIELTTYDYRFSNVRGPLSGWRAVDSTYTKYERDVVLVEVDDEAWRLVPESWPYPRGTVWGEVVKNLSLAGAKVIAFDIQFDAPEAKSNYLHQFSEQLGIDELKQFIPEHGDVVFGKAIEEAQKRGTKIVINSKMVNAPDRIPTQYIAYPTEAIMAGNPETGLINDLLDMDTFSRQYAILNYLSHDSENGHLTLGLKCVKTFADIPDTVIPVYDPVERVWDYGPYKIESYGETNAFLVNYYGPASGYKLAHENFPPWGTFPRYSLSQVIDTKDVVLTDPEEDIDWMSQFIPGEIPDWILALDPDQQNEMMEMLGIGSEFDVTSSPFYNKIILIGSTVEITHDFKYTPFYNYLGISQFTPGVETHANAVQTILDQNFIRCYGGKITEINSDVYSNRALVYHFLLIAGLSIITYLFVILLSPFFAGVMTFIEVCIFIAVSLGLFTNDLMWAVKSLLSFVFTDNFVMSHPKIFQSSLPLPGDSVLIPITAPLAGIAFTYLSNMVFQYINERKDKNYLKNTFGAYISHDLIDKMYEEKQEPKLGGVAGYHTAFFSDIQSFSSFSEVMEPEELVSLMNEYLTEMTDILIKQHGTLDKYIGDAIVAFFGAPVPVDNHEYLACITALEMQNKLNDLREKWEKGDYPKIVHEMQHRIGLSSGKMVTGNMGSKMRMNYTMTGDAVNLGARLETSCKQYGVYIQVEETLYQAVEDHFEWRFLDYVRVKGREKPVNTYELLGRKGEVSDSILKMRDHFEDAYSFYTQQKWREAIKRFTASEELEEMFPGRITNPSAVYIERCKYLKRNHPDKDWDGVWTLKEK